MTGPLHGPLLWWQAGDDITPEDVAVYADEARFWWRAATRAPWAGRGRVAWADVTMRGLWVEEALRRREMGT